MVSPRRAPQVRTCARDGCAVQFTTVYDACFCSSRCRGNAWRDRARQEPPDQLTVQTDLRDPYDSVCLSCSRVGATYSLTAVEARDRARAGLPRCSVCDGASFLEPVLLGRRVA